MKILSLDTSNRSTSVSILEDKKSIGKIFLNCGLIHSKVIPEIVKDLLNISSFDIKNIDLLAVCTGPGSFTGIRIGITIAKIYAWSLNIDITTISSIEAMMLSNKLETNIVPIIDARRGFVYCGIYNKDKNEIMRPRYMKYTDLKEELNKLEDYTYISNDEIEFDKECIQYDPDIEKIVSFYQDREAINPHIVNPEYLKLTEAEEKNKKNV